jgi:hypothetical protein
MMIIRVTGKKREVNREVQKIMLSHQNAGKIVAKYTEPNVPENLPRTSDVIIIANIVET